MTVIACDGRQIASDGLMTYGRERAPQSIKKITARNGRIIAAAGCRLFDTLIEWIEEGADPNSVPKIEDEDSWMLLVIEPDGRMRTYHSKAPYSAEAFPPFAMGCGAPYAMGAMLAGASARRAVEIACELDVYCGGEIVVFDLPCAQKEAAE